MIRWVSFWICLGGSFLFLLNHLKEKLEQLNNAAILILALIAMAAVSFTVGYGIATLEWQVGL